ncbi:MAG: hypothetical protein ACR650_17055 [Methylocystis sp.]|jgi:hypothetical protein
MKDSLLAQPQCLRLGFQLERYTFAPGAFRVADRYFAGACVALE